MSISDEEKRLYLNYQKDLLKLKKKQFKEELMNKMNILQNYCDVEDSYVNLCNVRDSLKDLIKELDNLRTIQREVDTYEGDLNDEFV